MLDYKHSVLWIKAFHIIFIIGWMGALLYLFQLFAYHHKENALIVQQRFQRMEKRLHYIVGWPSCLLTVATGVWMISILPGYLQEGWLHLKLLFVFLLLVFQLWAGRIRRKLIKDPYFYSERFFKWLHHGANLFLIGAVLAAVVKF